MKIFGIIMFLFSGCLYAAGNTLTIESGNTLKNVSVGDKIINIKEMKGVIKIELQSGETADEGLKKLNELINQNKFSLNKLKGFSEISYIKETNKMYIREYKNSNLTEMDCYTGETKHLGKVVNPTVKPNYPITTKSNSNY